MENYSLPFEDVLTFCEEQANNKNYNLRNLQQDTQFSNQIQELVSSYIGQIEFHHLKTQSQEEKDQLRIDFGEEENPLKDDEDENEENKENFSEGSKSEDNDIQEGLKEANMNQEEELKFNHEKNKTMMMWLK